MRKTLNLAMIFLLSFAMMSSTCSSDDDGGDTSNAAEIIAIENTAESGNWTITYYYDTDTDETSDYDGYAFTFSPDGTLTATNGVNTYNGSWSVTDDSSSSSSSDDDIDFNIFFASPPDFEELSDDWDIVRYSTSKIELIDVSGGGSGTDYLTFEKL